MSHASSASAIEVPRLAFGRRTLLSTMMFLEFAVWGAWFVVLGVYLKDGLKFDGLQIGSIYGTMALGTIFAPLFIGQIADRYFASEKLMGILHLAGAALLYAMASVTTFNAFFIVSLVYALFYSPTLVLANSITFAHVPYGGRDFPRIRVFGTIGWIVANWIVGLVLPNFVANAAASNAPLILAAGFSLLLGLFSFVLPHTPPAGKSGDAFPALRAIGLLRSPSFAVFFGVSFVITIVLAFYYGFTSIYLTDSTLPKLPESQRVIKLPFGSGTEKPKDESAAAAKKEALNSEVPEQPGKDAAKTDITPAKPSGGASITLDAATVMTIGQISEMFLLPFLPWFLRTMGMKWVLAMGMAAWGIRYYLFALGAHDAVGPWIVIASLALHGVCFDFFFAAGFIYVDNEAPNEIRASGQALFTFLTYGLGMWLGNIISGYVVKTYTSGTPELPVYDWYHIWIIPSVGVVASLVVFALFFRMQKKPATEVSLA
ncbi:MAG TPA: MFS transporter [Pirellulales bacterium]|nr:MFS transporter [Pirellulales bacterium]